MMDIKSGKIDILKELDGDEVKEIAIMPNRVLGIKLKSNERIFVKLKSAVAEFEIPGQASEKQKPVKEAEEIKKPGRPKK